MQNPVFKLEKVVRSKSEEEMQDFEGPLDLILYLLGKNKMEIQDISISLICDQYMAWLARRQEMDLEVASEFVTMASQLVYIKTRMLLSIEDEEAQSEMDALIASLEERKRNENYAKVKSMAARLEPMGEFGRNILTRPPEPVKRGKIYEYDQTPGGPGLGHGRDPGPGGAVPAAAPLRFPEHRPARALSRGEQGPGDSEPAKDSRRHSVSAAVSGQPQPQRGGGHLSGGAGAVPGPHPASGRE